MQKTKKTNIGIVGCGAIGEGLACFIESRLSQQARLAALCDKKCEAALALQNKLKFKPMLLTVDELIKKVDLIIEAASVKAANMVLRKALRYKKDVIILSVGAFLDIPDIFEQAKKQNVSIYVPSGAICGIDAVGALNLGVIRKITLVTSKPPQGLMGVKYLKEKKLDFTRLRGKRCVFAGSVADAIKYFPKNINVAATLLLASSFSEVQVQIIVDPHLKRNTHRVEIEAKEARVSIRVENVPAQGNAKTSALAILSTQHLLKKIFSPFKIGS